MHKHTKLSSMDGRCTSSYCFGFTFGCNSFTLIKVLKFFFTKKKKKTVQIILQKSQRKLYYYLVGLFPKTYNKGAL